MKYISLFSGIGGFDLGFDRAGMECVLQVEKDEKARAVLAHHWPNVPRMELVEDVTRDKIRQLGIETVDVLAGGFPCQDISKNNASGKGIDGELSGLWWEFHRIIGELRPRYAVVENVSNLINRGFERVLGSLAQIGYDAEWEVISACAFGAPHTRERMFIVAYPNEQRPEGGRTNGNGYDAKIFTGGSYQNYLYPFTLPGGGNRGTHWANEPGLDRMVNGVSRQMDRDRLRQLGNAIVPQVAEWIGRRIMAQ